MLRLTLTHLTFLGAAVPPASVRFGERTTVVHGPSDTGKSFVVDAIDYMCGAGSLKEIPERAGYSTVLLGLILPTGEAVTLSRATTGGSLGLHQSDVRSYPLPAPDAVLAAKHNPRSTSNVSRYLLEALEIDGRRIRRNVDNATDSLSFRNLAHLCIVDETQMQAETPPALTGNYVSRTKEVSALKMILENEDDSALVEVESSQQRSRTSSAQIDVIDRLIRELDDRLTEAPDRVELDHQLARLQASIDHSSRAVAEEVARRGQVTERLRRLRQREAGTRDEIGDAAALRSRFSLLLAQYDSDLERLAMIGEAGNLLGYFRPGVCVFCGAEPEDQHQGHPDLGNSTDFAASIESEVDKTRALRGDLTATLADVLARERELGALSDALRTGAEQLQQQVRALDVALEPQHGDLQELLETRTRLERFTGLYRQLDDLNDLKRQVSDEVQTATASAAAGLSFATLREFSSELSERLTRWGVPDADTIRYDRDEQDIVAGDQLRSAHGKGVRAILHAAFTLALAQYCFDRDLPHPGFVVLDSPLVTYRPPDQEPAPGEDAPPEDVVRAFYADIQQRFDGQVIVLENTDPPDGLDADTVDVVFSKSESGRYGFFPRRGDEPSSTLPSS